MREDWLLLAQDMVRRQIQARGLTDSRVLAALATVPRHRFVPLLSLEDAYSDRALPTACGQTISQPYIVAAMTCLLHLPDPLDSPTPCRVLEVGTGSGYQAAILAEMGARVLTIERIADLAAQARATLQDLGYGDRVSIHVGDGSLGYPAGAPFDRILVTAGAPNPPPALLAQLAVGGRMVIPVGSLNDQRLAVLVRHADHWDQHECTPCRFVPLVGAQGWPA
ncbi:MAG: protein-L-isoaspartate(D-aspartate) O-methyltransferase [Phycisphaeraceae bacterium]|nr:protein-L-isoaspartate(D-aspartate) O-methyltransferase [Phycisphaeraceae bacterium]